MDINIYLILIFPTILRLIYYIIRNRNFVLACTFKMFSLYVTIFLFYEELRNKNDIIKKKTIEFNFLLSLEFTMKYLSGALTLLYYTMSLMDYAKASNIIGAARKLNARGANGVFRLHEYNSDPRSLRGKASKGGKNDKKQREDSKDNNIVVGLENSSDLKATHIDLVENVTTFSPTFSPNEPVLSQSPTEVPDTTDLPTVTFSDPPFSEAQLSCAKGLFHYRKVDKDTNEVVFDYYLNVENGHCVVIDRRCPSFYDEQKITYSSCAPDCLLPGAKSPC